jgi:hypothetical protein
LAGYQSIAINVAVVLPGNDTLIGALMDSGVWSVKNHADESIDPGKAIHAFN